MPKIPSPASCSAGKDWKFLVQKQCLLSTVTGPRCPCLQLVCRLQAVNGIHDKAAPPGCSEHQQGGEAMFFKAPYLSGHVANVMVMSHPDVECLDQPTQ